MVALACLAGFTSSAYAALDGLTLVDSDLSYSETSPYHYTADEGGTPVTSTHVRAVFSSGTASYTVDGGSPVALTSATSSDPIALKTGNTSVASTTTIVVTHSVGGTDTSYTVAVRRHAWLSAMSMSVTGAGSNTYTVTPSSSDDPMMRVFTLTVPYSVTSLTTTMTGTGSGNGIGGGGWDVWGMPGPSTLTVPLSACTSLSVGVNNCEYIYVPHSPFTWGGPGSTYRLQVTREAAFTESTISALSLVDSDLSYSETSPYHYTADEGGTPVTSTHVRAVFSSGTASYTVDGGSPVALTSATSSDPIALKTGNTSVASTTTIVVTHSVGGTDTSYTVAVRRHAWLSAMSMSVTGAGSNTYTVTPSSSDDPMMRVFTLTVPYSVTSLTTTMTGTGSGNGIGGGGWDVWGMPGPSTLTVPLSACTSLSVGVNNCEYIYVPHSPFTWGGPGSTYRLQVTRASEFTGIAAAAIGSAAASGAAVVGETISASPSGVSGTPAPTVRYSWESAPDPSGPWTDAGAADSAEYAPVLTDVGRYLRVVATAANDVSSPASVQSAAIGPVQCSADQIVCADDPGPSNPGNGLGGGAADAPPVAAPNEIPTTPPPADVGAQKASDAVALLVDQHHRALGGGRTALNFRLRYLATGRYVVIVQDARSSMRRLVRIGSRLGNHTLTRAKSAPVRRISSVGAVDSIRLVVTGDAENLLIRIIHAGDDGRLRGVDIPAR